MSASSMGRPRSTTVRRRGADGAASGATSKRSGAARRPDPGTVDGAEPPVISSGVKGARTRAHGGETTSPCAPPKGQRSPRPREPLLEPRSLEPFCFLRSLEPRSLESPRLWL